MRGGSVARYDQRFDVVLRNQVAGDLQAALLNFCTAALAIGRPSGVSQIDHIFMRQQVQKLAQNA